MLHYIINSSIIWLAFLMLYEFFLRKESFHQISRIYLLVTLSVGLILPTISLKQVLPEQGSSNFYPSNRVVEMKNTYIMDPVARISDPISNSNHLIEIGLWAIYLIGVTIGILMLFKEMHVLFRLFKNGKKSHESGCIIIETQVTHCPFSIFNYIFIKSKDDFNHSEWHLILAHEWEHVRQYHSLDNIFLVVFRILFWFNPLSHIYFRKLRIVHEFQADQIGANNIHVYGSFLIDLNLLQGAPTLTHSFNDSPIKTRIAMLTQSHSTRIKLLKYFAGIPLLVLLVIFCTQTSFSGGTGSALGKVRFQNNLIEYGEFKIIPFQNRESMNQQNSMFLTVSIPDSLPVYDPANGQLLRMEKVLVEKVPVKINNQVIYGNESHFLIPKFETDYSSPVLQSARYLDEYLFVNLKNELSKLEDGRYELRLNNLVVDDKGKIAFFDQAAIEPYLSPDDKELIYRKEVRQSLQKRLLDILQGPIQFKPAMKNGKPVNVRFHLEGFLISVKNHEVKLVERPGC